MSQKCERKVAWHGDSSALNSGEKENRVVKRVTVHEPMHRIVESARAVLLLKGQPH